MEPTQNPLNWIPRRAAIAMGIRSEAGTGAAAAPTIKVTATIDGQQREIEISRPDGWLTQDEVGKTHVNREALPDLFKDQLRRRTAGLTAKTRAELLEDESFLGELAEKKRDFFAEKIGAGKPGKLDAAELERIQASIMEREVKPREERLTAAEQRIQKLLHRSLDAEVAEAFVAEDGNDDLLPLVQRFLRDKTRLHDESEHWYIADGEDFAVSTKIEKGKAPYRTVREELAEMRASGRYGSWFKGQQRGGTGSNLGGQNPPAGDLDTQIAAAEASKQYGLAGRLKAQRLQQIRSQQ